MKNDRERPVIVVVKRARGHAHHGGSWKVAFADFMTAMMAMFLVLWIVGQSTDVRSAIAGHFQDPLGRASEFGSSIMPGTGASRPPLTQPLTLEEITDIRVDRLGRLARHIQQQVHNLPNLGDLADQVEITLTDDGLRIELVEKSSSGFFRSGSDDLDPAGQAVLTALGEQLAELPNQIVIEGHTDAAGFATGARYTNWELSADRANTARRILVASGVAPDQIREIRGHADRQLRVADDPYAAENRRITITMELGPDALTSLRGGTALRPGLPDSTLVARDTTDGSP